MDFRKIILLTISVISCTNNNLWDTLPEKITLFISLYYPDYGVSAATFDGANYYVTIDEGPSMVFDSDMDWTAIDGRGMTIPQIFLFDQLPSALYSYLEETDNTSQVYTIKRNQSTYSLALLNTYLSYNISTQQISIDS